MEPNFSINWRNTGHWDVNGPKGRLFRIRGNPGNYVLLNERDRPIRKERIDNFGTIDAIMSYIIAILMREI